MKRRDALKALGTLAGSTALARVLPACGGPLPEGITTRIFLMMENRSYDHYFGSRSWLAGKPGNGLSDESSNPDMDGDLVAPWATTESSYCIVDPPHSWSASRTQFNDGANDGFVRAYQMATGDRDGPMQYMRPEHLPTLTALADAYTVCDRWHSSILGPTLPNRMYWHAATSVGAKSNPEVFGVFRQATTIYHRLFDAEIPWAYYYGDAPVLGVIDYEELGGEIHPFFPGFISHAAAGTLPPIAYIDPSFSVNDDHPPHHPLLGQQFIAAVYNALATSPQWNHCELVIAYDEHGGFYDHVPPPTTADERADEGFGQLGFRVPALVVGPYAKSGYVSSVLYDHTSALKHIENVHGLEGLNERTAAANDLSDCIDVERLERRDAAQPITLPGIEIDQAMLPDSCRYDIPINRQYDHDIIAWAESTVGKRRLGDLYRRKYVRDYTYGIADYLEQHNLGRIRR